MNKLIEFLHDKEAKSLFLGNNGFMAKRPAPTMIGIWYEGKVICKIFPDFIQREVQILPPDSADVCDRLTELLYLLGMPRLAREVVHQTRLYPTPLQRECRC